MLEPRRLAARAAARRMAAEGGYRLGEEVGYQVRFDRQWGDKTRILVVTEGLLVRMLQEDACLEQVSMVILDEFHSATSIPTWPSPCCDWCSSRCGPNCGLSSCRPRSTRMAWPLISAAL